VVVVEAGPVVTPTSQVVAPTSELVASTGWIVGTTRGMVDATTAVVEATRRVVGATSATVDATSAAVEATRPVVDATRATVDGTTGLVETTKGLVAPTRGLVEATIAVVAPTRAPVDAAIASVPATAGLVGHFFQKSTSRNARIGILTALNSRRTKIVAVSKARTKAKVVGLADQLAAGWGKHLGGVAQVTLHGRAYAPTEVAALLKRVGALQTNLDVANSAAEARLAEQRAEMSTTLLPLMRDVVTYAKVTFGSQPDLLADFGVSERAPKALTAEAKAATALKRVATREARGTRGKVQRKAIKGDVAGIVVKPVRVALVAGPVDADRPSAPAASPVTGGGVPPRTS
jgi:hypothetical protein